jgi:hypothetical protein
MTREAMESEKILIARSVKRRNFVRGRSDGDTDFRTYYYTKEKLYSMINVVVEAALAVFPKPTCRT